MTEKGASLAYLNVTIQVLSSLTRVINITSKAASLAYLNVTIQALSSLTRVINITSKAASLAYLNVTVQVLSSLTRVINIISKAESFDSAGLQARNQAWTSNHSVGTVSSSAQMETNPNRTRHHYCSLQLTGHPRCRVKMSFFISRNVIVCYSLKFCDSGQFVIRCTMSTVGRIFDTLYDVSEACFTPFLKWLVVITMAYLFPFYFNISGDDRNLTGDILNSCMDNMLAPVV